MSGATLALASLAEARGPDRLLPPTLQVRLRLPFLSDEMACFSCFSGLFSSARHSGAAAQPEKLQEDLRDGCGAVDGAQVLLTEPAEAVAAAPADEELDSAVAEAPPTAAEADPERLATQSSCMGTASIPPAAPETAAEALAAPAHFEGSDAEDGATGRAAKGCCVPRAGRRRNRGAKAVKREGQEAVKHEGQEATPKEADSAHDGSPGITGRTTASAGA
ncbi:unnamed protein product [Prorocentrum cordatum]|uniref:Uncharacterized protein n=1 Tax=Prorocentrum cordatum TaxID=2364126 RepID=A0ABN9W3P3_9DINO|nr:unnamed protein product [Polarella glacialis]